MWLSQGSFQLFQGIQRAQGHLDRLRSLKAAVATLEATQRDFQAKLSAFQWSLSAKDDQLLKCEEEVGFLKATAEELVDHNTQLSTQVGEAR